MFEQAQVFEYSNQNVPLKALDLGSSDGELVVLLHGFPDSPHGWLGVANELVVQGYRVVIPWLRGYTPESALSAFEFGVMPAVRDLNALVEALGNKPAHLVGHDWGSAIAAVHANSQSNPWLSVSLLAVPPFEGVLSAPWRTLKALPEQMRLSSYMWEMQKDDSAEKLAANDCERVRALWEEWSPGWEFTELQFEPVRQVFLDEQMGWAATRYYRSLFTVFKLDTWLMLGAAMGRMVHPVLALAGEQDGCMGRPFQEAMLGSAQGNPMIQTALLPDCGHFLQAEKPEEVAHLLSTHFIAARSSCVVS